MREFISVEGIDGAGKTTAARSVAALLAGEGEDVVVLDEFALGSESGLLQTALTTSPFISEGFAEGPRAAFLYMLYHEAAKFERARDGNSRRIILADRFVDSVLVYQGAFIESTSRIDDVVELGRLAESLLLHIGVAIPSRTYFLDVPVDIAARRISARDGLSVTSEQASRLEQFRSLFVALAAHNDRMLVMDGTLTSDVIANDIRKDVRGRLAGSS